MAENSDERSREDLTEEASPYRVEEFRKKGMVAQSKEITALAVLLATATAVYLYSPMIGERIAEFMREIFQMDFSSKQFLSTTTPVALALKKSLFLMVILSLPICAAGFLSGAIGSLVQIGSIFSWDPLSPDLSKVDPVQGLKRFFSIKQWADGLRLIFKLACVLSVTYSFVRSEAIRGPERYSIEALSLPGLLGSVAWGIFASLALILVVFAGIDYFFQKRDFSKKIRMTKQEAKQEHREREGDPQIRARIRSVQREMARRRMMQAVRKADVIVTNPTHIAVALVYDREKMLAPRVVAKGADHLAQRIKKIAAEAGVPLVENVPLARALHQSVKIGQYVPKALYQAVAEVLAYVYRLKKRGF